MSRTFAVVDLFAGPGGLAEGFANLRVRGTRPFRIALSVEKDQPAHQTLLLRSFLRQFEDRFPPEYYAFLNGEIAEPDWSVAYPDQWQSALDEALHLELGADRSATRINAKLDAIKERHGDNVVLIGGPPCQAYSLAGRSRNKGIKDYVPQDDHRHFLYREYIRILKRLQPAAFVMENVKGLLSSSVDGERIFDRVLEDLRSVGKDDASYELIQLAPSEQIELAGLDTHAKSTDYVIEAEDFGIPQARHRVIIVGIKRSRYKRAEKILMKGPILRTAGSRVAVRAVLRGMPRLRSGLSEIEDNEENWKKVVVAAFEAVAKLEPRGSSSERVKEFSRRARACLQSAKRGKLPASRCDSSLVGIGRTCPAKLRRWIVDPMISVLPNNETRSHMASDLKRYFFASVFGLVAGVSPKASTFPKALAPDHGNWASGDFADRFRVQLWDLPSTTITSHISKDGHYFIHPDPLQCRSLTVREAARLQTFPDNYFFKGNRTQQYVQVGNAVPPFLALLIARSLHRLLAQRVGIKRKSRSG